MNYSPLSKAKAEAMLEYRKRRAENSRPIQLSDLKIMTKRRTIGEFKLNAVQENLLKNLTGRDLVLKSRQVGVSTAVQAWLFAEAINTTARIGVIAHDDDTTQKMRDMQQLFYDELPSNLKPERARNSATRAYYPRTKSQVYIATAGNRTAGRGGTYSHIHGCLSPDTQIITPNGRLVRMGDMQIGDNVVTHNGDIAPISFISQLSKQAFEVTLKGLRDFPLIATGEHRFYSNQEWIKLSHLSAGDTIGYPVAVIENDGAGWQFKQPEKPRPQGGGSREHVPDYICPSYELGRVIGLYLAEGCIIKQSKTKEFSGVTFTVHEKEVVRTCEWLNEIDDLYTSYKVAPVKNSKTVHITAYGKSFAAFMHSVAGETDSKQLPNNWKQKGVEFVRGLVHGYLAGDGHFSASRDRRISASSIRSALTIGMRDALASLGYGWASIQHEIAGIRHGRNEREQWTLRLTGSGVIDLSKELGKPFVEYQHPQKGNSATEIKDGYAWIPIVSIKPNGQTDVMDFEIAHEDHSYCTIHGATHNSEVAFWSNANQIVAGMMQGVPPDGHVVFESTANGAQGWFYLEVMAALRGESDFTVHFYPWFWDTDAVIPLTDHEVINYTPEEKALAEKHNLTSEQIKWRRVKQRELRELFPQEYPESIETAFLTSGDNVFGDVKQYLNTGIKQIEPIKDHHYTGAMDWGQADDYTTLSIKDDTANCEAYMNRWRRQDWATMRREALDACEDYGVELLAVEQNSASSNIEELIYEVEQRGLKTDVHAFVMTNLLKGNMVSVFKTMLQDEGYRLLDIDYATAEMQQWQTKQSSTGLWQYTHPDGGHDDTIIARIAAVYHAAQDFSMTIETAPEELRFLFSGRR